MAPAPFLTAVKSNGAAGGAFNSITLTYTLHFVQFSPVDMPDTCYSFGDSCLEEREVLLN